jgi:hypothetical protein
MDVAELAARWAALNPELADRLSRAVVLIEPSTMARDVYYVRGAETPHTVVVDRTAKASTCTCADHKYRGVRCKHRLAVALSEVAKRKVKKAA